MRRTSGYVYLWGGAAAILLLCVVFRKRDAWGIEGFARDDALDVNKMLAAKGFDATSVIEDANRTIAQIKGGKKQADR